MSFVFGGDVLRFYHGGDECLTVPANWSEDGNNMVIYEGGAVMAQARSLWRLDLVRTKWAGGFINWGKRETVNFACNILAVVMPRLPGEDSPYHDRTLLGHQRERRHLPVVARCGHGGGDGILLPARQGRQKDRN